LSPQAQAKLLRVIETGDVLSVGRVTPKSVDVRVIAASSSDLFALMTMGRFRRDLYYRLSAATLHIPPLRQRRADIPALAQHFATMYAGAARLPAPEFDAGAIAALEAHDWPGNVRELENVVQRAAVLAKGSVIQATDLQLEAGVDPGASVAYDAVASTPRSRVLEGSDSWEASMDSTKDGATRAELEAQDAQRQDRARIVEALAQAHGNQVVAARLLGLSRRTLIHRLDVYRIPRPRKGQR
jgi:DNA-binding NtrC family response regulator